MARQPLILRCCLVACIGLAPQQALAGKKATELVQSRAEIPDEHLLDVGIRVFSPGFPENPEALRTMQEKGVFTAVRRSEARYFPVQMVRTLQSSGFWGTVRVIPDIYIADVAVSGTILSSTPMELEIKVVVVDARGKVWLKKKYKEKADYSRFYRKENRRGPYQSLYNRIANDMRKARAKLDDDDVARIRSLSRLRFAAELVPDAFDGYLSINKKLRYSIERLPATEDPMMARVISVRQRDQMFIDILNEYYADFHTEMREPYDEWRERCYGRQLIAEKLGRRAFADKFAGAGIILGGIVAAVAIDAAIDDYVGNDRAGDVAADVVGELAFHAGGAVIQEGTGRSVEARMHRETIRELSESLDIHVAPVLVEFDGEVTRLHGTMETLYACWRELLLKIFASETGLPLSPNLEIVREARASSIG